MAEASLVGQRGRLVGAHPWAGHSGEIVRLEKTPVGWAAVVRLDGSSQEAMVFDGWLHWRAENGSVSSGIGGWGVGRG